MGIPTRYDQAPRDASRDAQEWWMEIGFRYELPARHICHVGDNKQTRIIVPFHVCEDGGEIESFEKNDRRKKIGTFLKQK
jgi:hypothetical protein